MKYVLHSDFPLLAALLDGRGWKRTYEDDWNLHWGSAEPERPSAAAEAVRCNHFPGSLALHRKDLLAGLLRRTPGTGFRGIPGVLAPDTFVLPDDREALNRAAADDPSAIWIYKPLDWSGGDGIRLLASPQELPDTAQRLVQRYMDRPHLIDGHRHTFRIFVAVLSLDPFVLYICRDGLLKRAAHPYATDAASLADPVIHLTNSAVQHTSPHGNLPVLSMDDFADILRAQGHDDAAVWESVRSTCARTILTARQVMEHHALQTPAGVVPFDFFGFDIMLDSDLQPWVIEVNRNPSMHLDWGAEGPEERIKTGALSGILDLAFPGDGAEPLPATCGSWERLFPHPQADSWCAEWLPTEADCATFRACGLAEPVIARRDLLRDATFVDDGVVLFSPDRREFLTLNDSAAMVALRNDEGEPATAETLPIVRQVWQYVAPLPSPEPLEPVGVTRVVPAGPLPPGECFLINEVRVHCAVPEVSVLLREYLPAADPAVESAEWVYLLPSEDQVYLISRLGTLVCRPGSFVGLLFHTAAHLLSDARGCLAHFPGTAVRIGDVTVALCGLPERGKTTLAAALCLAGAELISDSVILLDHACLPMPLDLPMLAPTGGLQLVHPQPLPAADDAPSVHDNRSRRCQVFAPRRAQTSAPLGSLLFVRLAPGEQTRMEPLGVCDSLFRLRETGLRMPNAPTLQDGGALLAALAAAARAELTVGSVDEAVRTVLASVRIPAANL